MDVLAAGADGGEWHELAPVGRLLEEAAQEVWVETVGGHVFVQRAVVSNVLILCAARHAVLQWVHHQRLAHLPDVVPVQLCPSIPGFVDFLLLLLFMIRELLAPNVRLFFFRFFFREDVLLAIPDLPGADVNHVLDLLGMLGPAALCVLLREAVGLGLDAFDPCLNCGFLLRVPICNCGTEDPAHLLHFRHALGDSLAALAFGCGHGLLRLHAHPLLLLLSFTLPFRSLHECGVHFLLRDFGLANVLLRTLSAFLLGPSLLGLDPILDVLLLFSFFCILSLLPPLDGCRHLFVRLFHEVHLTPFLLRLRLLSPSVLFHLRKHVLTLPPPLRFLLFPQLADLVHLAIQAVAELFECLVFAAMEMEPLLFLPELFRIESDNEVPMVHRF
mmetsp:Transcript_81435/g.226837  ORF Transcript_81435/g.226837 Transcript_81435/m.226837 type:complete len:387 (-) Transcript_81435:699-1859(-)